MTNHQNPLEFVDAELQPNHRFLCSQVILFVAFIPHLLVAIYSIFWPLDYTYVINVICDHILSICTLTSSYNDQEILFDLGFGDYATSFQSLRIFGLLISPFNVVTSTIVATLIFDRDKKHYENSAKAFLTIIFAPIMMWFVYLSPDFYGAHDGDFSGLLRPYYGSILYVISVYFVSGVYPGLIYLIVREKFF